MSDVVKKVLIIGAGPAGLSAAYELSKNKDISVLVIEAESKLGGLSKTIEKNGNRFDIGPHRFFSKVERVNSLWQEIIPLEDAENKNSNLFLLKVRRLTRILFLNKFFNYPITLNLSTIKNLGFKKFLKICFSYLKAVILPIKKEESLADFFTNRFGRELFLTFFKDYTEKVWGVPCEKIPADWGIQRVKGLSIFKLLLNFLKKLFHFKIGKEVETSLIDSFVFPVLGAGQMYEEMAKKIILNGGQIYLNHKFVKLKTNNNKIVSLVAQTNDLELKEIEADYFISSAPVKELIGNLDCFVPEKVKDTASSLMYRDFIIVSLLFKKINKDIPDNWIYIQEQGIKMGRLDIFNNFSRQMLKDSSNFLFGAEYFCSEGDFLWQKSDEELKELAVAELEKIGIAGSSDLLDFSVVKVLKAYPSYFGSYNNFDEVVSFVNNFSNLFLIGRNGMHRYNNMDHSILSGLMAADNIINGVTNKHNLWQINTDDDYHEIKKNNN